MAVEGNDRSEILSTITTAVAELNCLIREGWDKEELADVRTQFCNQLAEGNPDDARSSIYFCDDFTDYVISGDRYMTAPAERKQLKEAMLHVQNNDLQ